MNIERMQELREKHTGAGLTESEMIEFITLISELANLTRELRASIPSILPDPTPTPNLTTLADLVTSEWGTLVSEDYDPHLLQFSVKFTSWNTDQAEPYSIFEDQISDLAHRALKIGWSHTEVLEGFLNNLLNGLTAAGLAYDQVAERIGAPTNPDPLDIPLEESVATDKPNPTPDPLAQAVREHLVEICDPEWFNNPEITDPVEALYHDFRESYLDDGMLRDLVASTFYELFPEPNADYEHPAGN